MCLNYQALKLNLNNLVLNIYKLREEWVAIYFTTKKLKPAEILNTQHILHRQNDNILDEIETYF